jgi:hypothetical protein
VTVNVPVPHPYSLTKGLDRDSAIRSLPRTTEVFRTALDTLSVLFDDTLALERRAGVDIPETISDAFMFIEGMVSNRSATLDGVTRADIREVIADLMGEQPSEELVEGIERVLERQARISICLTIMEWLPEVAAEIPENQKKRMVALTERHWARIPDGLASALLSSVSSVAQRDAIPLLRDVAAAADSALIRNTAIQILRRFEQEQERP